MRHERYTNETKAPRVKNLDFDNEKSENIFSHPYISYVTNEKLQGVEQFQSKNYLLETPCSHAKMQLESTPQKPNFVMEKAMSRSYTLDYRCKFPCRFPHSYA